MELTAAVRVLLQETAHAFHGARRRRFLAETVEAFGLSQRQAERQPSPAFEPHRFACQYASEYSVEPAQSGRQRFHIRSTANPNAFQESPHQNNWEEKSIRVAGPFDNEPGIRQSFCKLILTVAIPDLELFIVRRP